MLSSGWTERLGIREETVKKALGCLAAAPKSFSLRAVVVERTGSCQPGGPKKLRGVMIVEIATSAISTVSAALLYPFDSVLRTCGLFPFLRGCHDS
jgi:hypothetical protein